MCQIGLNSIEFWNKYTKLAMLSFLYCFVVKGKLISAKDSPLVGIESAALSPKYLQYHAYLTVLPSAN